MARNKFDIDEILESPFNFKHLKRVLIYAERYKNKMIYAFLINVVSILAGLVAPFITQYAVDVTIPEKNVAALIILTAVLMATIIISVILRASGAKVMTEVGQSIIYDIRKDLFEKLQRLSFEYYDSRPHGKILSRIINYVNGISEMLSNGIIAFFLEAFSLLFIVAFMFAMHWRLALYIIAGVPLLMAVVGIIKKGQRKSWQGVSNKGSNLNAYLHEGIQGVKITQLFTRESENAGIFSRLGESLRKIWMKAVGYNNILWPSVDVISAMIMAFLYFSGLVLLGPDMVTFGTIIAMSGYASRFWQPILNISNLFNNFVNSISYLERIFETLDEPVSVHDEEGAEELSQIKGGVRFENVTFSYDTSDVILENLSFEVNPGESVALVGPTGAGKTTIVNLISRFYNLNGGRILIDGTDISKVTLKSLRSQMGIMLQDAVIFSGSIIDNIRYGKLDATFDEVTSACRTVYADEFINETEKGYETELNERSAILSQGQKQLLSFARTVISDPRILILDEATSTIDVKTEKMLQQGLLRLLKNRTSFIIAHRLSTIKNCDKIMYISDKGITECGTHEELIAKKGDYYKLCAAGMF